jgi:DMSO/TMAO reductase YedYZ heme-binding membrane subunit
VYFGLKHEVPSATGLAIGGAGYALLFAMLVTSWSFHDTDGRRWRRLHAYAPHYLWFVMLATYVSRVSERGTGWLPFVALTLAALVVRIAWRWRTPRWQTAAEVR